MGSNSVSKNKNSQLTLTKTDDTKKSFNSINNNSVIKHENKSILENIKSKYILKQILDNLQKLNIFKIIKCNKAIQNSLNMNINNYKEFSETLTQIEIDIIPADILYQKFINIDENEQLLYYHIYFNDSKKEIKKNTFSNKNEEVKKIKIIIGHEIKIFF